MTDRPRRPRRRRAVRLVGPPIARLSDKTPEELVAFAESWMQLLVVWFVQRGGGRVVVDGLGTTAEIEALARLEVVTRPLGDGSVELTLGPGPGATS